MTANFFSSPNASSLVNFPQDNSTLPTQLNHTTSNSCINCSSTQSPASSYNPVVEQIFCFLYVLAIVLGTAGNLTSIIVFTKGRRCNTDIRGFLVSLAVADLLMALICIPVSFVTALLKEWVLSPPLCPIIMFTQALSVTVSVYTNTAISIDRFVAIKFPLKLIQTSRRHVLWVVGVIWIVSSLVCAVQLWVSRVEPNNSGVLVCAEMWTDLTGHEKYGRLYTVAVLIITYVIPVIVIMTMYSLVCVQLWFRTTPGVEDHARNTKQLKNKRKVSNFSIIGLV